ncbi:MAG TPA: hypothetical protein VMW23_06865, partial [Sedimentisphaerales bacterium]|nr:hypothetical protein [Sedimentisphaerales bacterium]
EMGADMTEEFENDWAGFGVHLGPFGFGCFPPRRYVRYGRTETSHILHMKIDPDTKKEEIKVRLVRPGVLDIEWPRRVAGEEIPVQ